MEKIAEQGMREPYPNKKCYGEMYETDRFFLPRAGYHNEEDCIVRVFLNEDHCEIPGDHNQFEIDFIDRKVILEAASQDPSYSDAFDQYIKSHCRHTVKKSVEEEFVRIATAFDNTVNLSNREIVDWAEGIYHNRRLVVQSKHICGGQEYFETIYYCSIGEDPYDIRVNIRTSINMKFPEDRKMRLEEYDGFHFFNGNDEDCDYFPDIVSAGGVMNALALAIGF